MISEDLHQQIREAVRQYHAREQKANEEFNARWPYRVDLGLPLDEHLRKTRIIEMYQWFKAQKVDYIPGPTVPMVSQGFCHMTVWLKRKDLATLCKLTWSGK